MIVARCASFVEIHLAPDHGKTRNKLVSQLCVYIGCCPLDNKLFVRYSHCPIRGNPLNTSPITLYLYKNKGKLPCLGLGNYNEGNS